MKFTLLVLVAAVAVASAAPLDSGWAAQRAEEVLQAINAVEVPPFAYPSANYEYPNTANIAITAAPSTGETVLTVRLRQDTARVPGCITGMVNAGFLCGFDYRRWKDPEFHTGAALWRAGNNVYWEFDDLSVKYGQKPKAPPPTRVDFQPTRIVIEVYLVKDSVLSWSQLGAVRTQQAWRQCQRPGLEGVDVEFYWRLQRALPFATAGKRIMRDICSPGVIGSNISMCCTGQDDVLALAKLPIPELSSTPKSMRMVERWTLNRTMKTSVRIDDPGVWTVEQVRSAAVVDRF